ncbi:HNH endonuclease [Corynebacterium crudilactis]|uniref:HNH endonuclease n=2 Tax=Corynebacterium crudilactis TaxID=1652495 RepID=A0A172QX64_9CORY|nr:HNH endonuclease [Corynebacterium crudilactis]
MITDIYFSHNNPHDPYTHHTTELNRDTHQLWVILTTDSDDFDSDSFITEAIRITGYSRHEVNNGLHAMAAMTNLPHLRAIQERYYFLGIRYLASIMIAVAKADPALWEELDLRITDALTPVTDGEVMIQSSTLAKRIAMWIKELDPAPASDPSSQQDYVQVHTTDEATYVRIKISGSNRHLLNDIFTQLAEVDTGLPEALMALLAEKTTVKVTKYLYSPHHHPEQLWSPDDGDIDPDAYANCVVECVKDLDGVAETTEKSYTPSEKMKALIRARDGHCRFPGCCVKASKCQVDHIIPWDQGGPTAAWNLQLLCQRHHNMKTDGRYVAEANGMAEVRWVGPMDVPAVTRPSGPLVKEMPRGVWGQLLRNRLQARFERIRDRALNKED